MLFLEKFGCGDCWQLESSCQNRAAELIKKGEKTKDFNSEILSKLDEAKKISRMLLEKRLVACASIFPHVTSLYWWEGEIEEGQEIKVLLKTKKERFGEVLKEIRESCSYSNPEVSALIITDVSPEYLEWMESSVGPADPRR